CRVRRVSGRSGPRGIRLRAGAGYCRRCDGGVGLASAASARTPTPRMSYRLLLLPDPALLVPPARARARDPLAGEDVADLRLPFRMAVGHGDLAVDRLAVAVVVGDGGVDRDPVLDRQLRGIAHRHRTVAGKTPRTGIELRAHRGEARLHARLDRLDRRGADGDVRLRLRLGAADAEQHPGI